MPVGFTPDIFVVRIFDKSAVLPSGAVDVIFSQVVSPRATSFTIPSTLTLRPDNPYVISLEVTDLRPGPIGGALRRSVSFFEFRLGGDGGPAVVELPTVGLDPDPTDGFGAPYRFGFTITDPSVVRFLDPLVAIGYDYATGPGNPNFASVIFPGVGDGLFELSFDGTTQTVAAGVTYLFPAGGVSRFSVRGIEASAGLDPGNVTAFVTGLTFTGPGDFTGTMTPVIQLVPGASVQITVNQSSVASGQTLTVGVQANNPAGQPSADLFVGVLLPDGLTAVFLSPSGAFIGSGSVVHPAAFVPLQLVPGGSSVSLPTLLALTLPAGGAVPAGVYTVFGALVRAGALIDDRIDPGDIVAIDLKSVTVTQ
jgi:hypothetical protein